MINYVGKKLGKLTILAELPSHITPNGSRQRIVKVHCDCGNEYTTRLTTAKKTKMCTKCKKRSYRKNLVGNRYGKLVIVKPADDYISPSGFHLTRWLCKCDCGNFTCVNTDELTSGSTRSCGCLKNTKGLLKDNSKLMRKYDFEKNKNLNLNRLTARSSKKIWWKCPNCHNSWFATIASQNDKIKHGCPYCSGRLVIKGKTDLYSKYPNIVKEYWDFEKNKVKPDEISAFSGKKVWWKCNVGHHWKATVANKVNGSGCPKCNIENVNSFCEQAFYFYLKQAFPDAINGDQHIGMELDIYLPSIKTGIEYDGEAWHKSKRKTKIDQRKNLLCIKEGIKLLRVREPKLSPISNCIIFTRKDSSTEASLDEVISKVLNYLKVNSVNVNTLRDGSKILAQFAQKKYKNSLMFLYPDVAREWDYEKNGGLKPDEISKGSNYKVWWKDNLGHEWQAAVADRTRSRFTDKNGRIHNPQGCPYCSGRRVLTGFNDLASLYPKIARKWDYVKNNNIKPTEVTSGSSKKYWWICEKGHSYYRNVESEVRYDGRCPVCFKKNRGKRSSVKQ